MGKKKRNFMEATGEDAYTNRDAGKKKPHVRRRRSTDAKYEEIRDLFDERTVEETPPPARNLHVVARMPEEEVPYHIEPTPETAARKPLAEESDAEKIAKIDEKIISELTEPEQIFAKSCIDEYPKELGKAINKIESKGSTVAEKQISAIRISYISDAKRWGIGRQLAPEKAELLGKYLELKLPVGIPEEKPADNQKTNKNIYSGEKSKAFLGLLKRAGKYFRDCFKDSDQWGDEYGGEEARKKLLIERLQAALPGFLAQNQELKKHFAEEDAPMVIERVIRHIKIFNNIE